MKSATQHNTAILSLLIALALISFALVPRIEAAPQVAPAPDGCYPNFTTAEGCNALHSLITGAGNTGIGWYSLFLDTTGNFNTGVGGGALALNNADSNTAVGAAALLLNTAGTLNTAVGTDALVYNDTGSFNTANGAFALFGNTEGDDNTANGVTALESNTTGSDNTATGAAALFSNTTGNDNTANGLSALTSNTTGVNNTAVGSRALSDSTTGEFNTALGTGAGSNQTTGSGNVYIGGNMFGVAGESDACYIRSIAGRTSVSGMPVLINLDNKLGTVTSSKRFKEDIKPMDQASELLFSLKPVTFRYKKEIDPVGTSQLGLVAEEVEKVNPDLVVRDKEGKPYSVRYDQVNAMMLNEFLKEHRAVQQLKSTAAKQEATIEDLRSTVARQEARGAQLQKSFQSKLTEQQKQIQTLTSGLQKVSAQLEMAKPDPQVVGNQR
jgi:uncharacterized coiled-coil protein SlyX